ncbi:glycoside hydrolase family 15 protein [Candidatus Saccharibacteria bacterium]|nr:glycoside hydrolase family 15 protein [Candidatus Saccharibacteria bacterium]
MARSVILGNGSLTVGLNETGNVHDFYYPYVGLDNLTSSRLLCHKIGVSIDSNFSWTDDGSWDIEVDFESEALVSHIRMKSNQYGIELHFQDFVDSEHNAFIRRINVINSTDKTIQLKLFLHQAFQISKNGRGDTALFVPDDNYILDYKGRCCLLISGLDQDTKPFDQFAVGNYEVEGKQGTYLDAEDGELSNNPVEHGGVDSVIRFSSLLKPKAHHRIDYWIIAADSQFTANTIHTQILDETINKRFAATRHYWSTWLSQINPNVMINPDYKVQVKKSLMLIKAHTDKMGGIIASCDSSIYNYGRDYYSYVWPRDGAYAMWPLIRLGYTSEPRKFFEFCRDILTSEGYLMHKYQPDRAIGSTWHPLIHNNHKELAIQQDETAIILFMLGEYYEYTKDRDFIEQLYSSLIQPTANFLCRFTDQVTELPHASYDLWEEKFATHTYTVSVVYQALLVAADFAELLDYHDDIVKWDEKAQALLDNRGIFYDSNSGNFRKSFSLNNHKSLSFDNTCDISSIYGVIMFGYHENDVDKIKTSLNNTADKLLNTSPSGGVVRYEGDNYFASDPKYKGNPWIVATLWLAQLYVRAKDNDSAKQLLQWSINHCLKSGILPEQVDPTTGEAKSVTPLVWSHAELINTILDMSS